VIDPLELPSCEPLQFDVSAFEFKLFLRKLLFISLLEFNADCFWLFEFDAVVRSWLIDPALLVPSTLDNSLLPCKLPATKDYRDGFASLKVVVCCCKMIFLAFLGSKYPFNELLLSFSSAFSALL